MQVEFILEKNLNMKNIFILLIALGSLNCSNDKYEAILEGLTKNYVLLSNQMEISLYLEYFKLTKEQHLNDLEEYNKSVSAFYNADKDILSYLLSYEQDTTHICKWIKTKNPYSSNIGKMDLLTNAEGALILFDNYLINSSNIKIPDHIDNLSFEKLRLFYAENKRLSKEELKKKYEKIVKQGNVGNGTN